MIVILGKICGDQLSLPLEQHTECVSRSLQGQWSEESLAQVDVLRIRRPKFSCSAVGESKGAELRA